jgi:nitrite reductase/ring-hydroxylating ferredoxin subunit
MALKYSAKQLMDGLSKLGFVFRNFSLESEGDYAVDDADFNYKDVPHLNYVHKLVEGVPSVIGDDFSASLFVQRVFGLRIPLCATIYESSKAPLVQTYYVSWLWFVLIIETRYVAVAPNRTKVMTTYNLGTPPLLRWVFPIVRHALTKNYKDLMSGDIPMRERRGYLRTRGFSFKKDAETYGFRETLKIQATRVVPPRSSDKSARHIVDVSQLANDGAVVLIGEPDHLGLQMQRRGMQVRIFPRLCMHEGACLDQKIIAGDEIGCPWHGRKYAACLNIDTKLAERQVYEDDLRRIVYENGTVSVYPVSD